MVSIPQWDDAIVPINLDEIRSKCDYLLCEIHTICVELPKRSNLILMLDSVDKLTKVYQSMDPHSGLLYFILRAYMHSIIGMDSWEVVKATTKNVDVHRELFYVPMDHARLSPFKLRDFENEATSPHL